MIHKVTNGTAPVGADAKARIHSTIQDAVDQAKPGDIIEIGKGRYEEKLTITTSGLTLIGESSEDCIITYGDFARKSHEDGRDYGTFRSYTCLVLADDVALMNLTVENSAGDGRKVGQAIALFAEGDRLIFRNCRLIGHQDTLFTGPLPQKPNIPGSFAGPTEHRPYRRSRQYYHNCYIIGDIDFIFGSALAVFNQCKMETRDRGEEVNGYVTAPSTWEGEPYGLIFIDCVFSGEKGIAPGTVFLGRPWRPYGQSTLIRCVYDESIHEDHWDPWGNEANKATARFSEYGCKLNRKNHVQGMEEEIEATDSGEPFDLRELSIPALDFLDAWHREMMESDEKNPVLGRDME